MGNFPYPSSYLLHGDAMLPAWPVRAACAPLMSEDLRGDALVEAAGRGLGVYYNASADKKVHDQLTRGRCSSFRTDPRTHGVRISVHLPPPTSVQKKGHLPLTHDLVTYGYLW